jgi:hypothetical protein
LEFARVIALVRGFLIDRKIHHALAGGLALAAYGLPRTTFDLDLVVDGDWQQELIDFLEAAGFGTLFRSVGYSNHLHNDPSLGRVDVIYVRGGTREKIFSEARLMPGPGGSIVPVARPEHLAAMKVQAMKNDPSRAFGDMADIGFLLRLPGVDRGEIAAYFDKHGMGDRFRELEASL